MFRRLLSPFVIVLTAILVAVYAYLAWRLASGAPGHAALAIPFVLIWLVPVVYWVGDRDRDSFADEALHFASYLSMGWLNFAFFLSVACDLLLLVTAAASFDRAHLFLLDSGPEVVLVGSVVALVAGAVAALRGPRVRRVDIPIEGLDERLDGVRIVQISDLHVGQSIGLRYVSRVARMANELQPDLVALTGDLVDGSVARLAADIAPLGKLSAPGGVFFITGNHEYYSGAPEWIEHFRKFGWRVLLNEHAIVSLRGARLLVGGVVDPAARMSAGPINVPRPDLAAGKDETVALRILLAHNPKLAALGEAAGFDLQLSGHTHAGQFFPWTLAVRLIHAPHAAGLSKSGRMWVYVSAGTGSWGPPVRLGSTTELTLIRLIARPN
jgi:predicted MPP superfamily phosphohydrolase